VVKRSGLGTSRAARKAARVRKHRAEVRGLPVQPEPAARAAEVPLPRARPRQEASAATRSRFPLAAKVAVFLVLLLAAVWGGARYRHGLLD